jgi:hypothetical protein
MAKSLEFDLLARDRASDKFRAVGRASDAAGNKMDGFKARTAVMGEKVAKVAKMAAFAFAAVGVAAVAAAPKVVDHAAKLEQMGRKAQIVFGDQLPLVQKWAKENAHAMGLTTREAVNAAAGIQDLLVPMGFARDEATKMTLKLSGLSGALSEWSNGTRSAAEVNDILSAALLGERDALQGLGIGISQAAVDAEVLRLKKKGVKAATEEQYQAIATLNLIMDKSKDAQKAYATGNETIGRRARDAKTKLRELGDELTVKLTPAILAAADAFEKRGVPAIKNWAGTMRAQVPQMVQSFARGMDKILAVQEVALKAVALIPGPWQSAYRKAAAGVGQARAAVRDLIDTMEDLKPKTVAVKAIVSGKAAVMGLGESISGVRSKTVTVTANVRKGNIGNLLIDTAAGRHAGGPVRKGVPYIVGEKRPELFVPESDGTILPRVPRGMRGAAMAGGGGVTVNVNVNGSLVGGDQRKLAYELQGVITRSLSDAMRTGGFRIQANHISGRIRAS